ncbi:MAG: 2-hydroxyacyl-CoA dehydratase subunit D [Butyricicoccus sp.]
MEKYIELLGSYIEKKTLTSPESARKLLTAAYSWVHFSGKRKKSGEVQAAYSHFNAVMAESIVQSFRKPDNAVMVNIFMPCELLHAMGHQPMFPEGISVYLACTACQHVFAEASEAQDVPESFCSYHKTMIGAAETGVMPAPRMIVNTTLACDANQLSFRRLADFYHVPQTIIDVPDRQNEESVQYVAGQLRTFAAQLQDLSQTKLDEEKLMAAVACSARTLELCRRYWQARANVTQRTTMTGELCSLMANHCMLGRPESERYMQELLNTARHAPDRRTSSKKRILWMHTLPNWQDSMKQIFELDGRCELVGCDMTLDYPGELDPTHPYESMARRLVYNTSNGSARHRIQAAIAHARQLHADGVILFCHWGCKQTMGLSQLAKQALEGSGFPTLVLDGDGCDSRNVADGQMITRVNAFLEQLEERSA